MRGEGCGISPLFIIGYPNTYEMTKLYKRRRAVQPAGRAYSFCRPGAQPTGPAPATPLWPPAARSGAAAGAILPIVARPKAVKYVQKGGANKRRRAVQPAGRAYSFCRPGAQPTGPAPAPPLWPPAARSGAAAGAILPIVARPKAVKYVQKGGASKRRRAVQPAGRAYSFCRPGAQPTGP